MEDVHLVFSQDCISPTPVHRLDEYVDATSARILDTARDGNSKRVIEEGISPKQGGWNEKKHARVPDHTPVGRLNIIVALVDIGHLDNSFIERLLCPADTYHMSDI